MVRQVMKPPNTRMQRTRSRSPLMRSPLDDREKPPWHST